MDNLAYSRAVLTILLLGIAFGQQPKPTPAPSCKPPLVETVTKAGVRTCAAPAVKSGKATAKKKAGTPKPEPPKFYTRPSLGDVLPRNGSKG